MDEVQEQRTVWFFFSDHSPITFTGNSLDVMIQIVNARLHPGCISWDEAPTRPPEVLDHEEL